MRTKTVTNLLTVASSQSLKRLGSSPEPLSPTGLAGCVTQRTAVIFQSINQFNSNLAAREPDSK